MLNGKDPVSWKLDLPDLLTQVGLWTFTELAFPTLRYVQWYHVIP